MRKQTALHCAPELPRPGWERRLMKMIGMQCPARANVQQFKTVILGIWNIGDQARGAADLGGAQELIGGIVGLGHIPADLTRFSIAMRTEFVIVTMEITGIFSKSAFRPLPRSF